MITQCPTLQTFLRVSKSMLLLGLGLTMLVGCSASTDKHSVKSTMHRPATVEVVDTYNDKVLWSKDVPPGQTIDFDFNDPGAAIETFSNSGQWPTSMTWSTEGPGQTDSGTVELPGTPIMHRTTYVTSRTIEGPVTMPAGGQAGAPLEPDTSSPSNDSSTNANQGQTSGQSDQSAGQGGSPDSGQNQNNNEGLGQPLPGDEPANGGRNDGEQ